MLPIDGPSSIGPNRPLILTNFGPSRRWSGMHYYRAAIEGKETFVVRDRENDLFGLSGTHGELTSFRYLATVSDMFGKEIDSVTRELLDSAPVLDGDSAT